MTGASSLSLHQVVMALEKNGFVLVGKRGSHVRLQKRTSPEVIKIIVPAHAPIKRTTIDRIEKEAGVSLS